MSDDANLPVIPDKVAAKIRDGKDVSLEEISSAATEMREQRKLEAARPVDGRTLKPISRAQANTITYGNPQGRIERGTLPRAPATRRVIPPPFQRERITIRVPGEPVPEWRTVKAIQVCTGDIVPGVGLVMEVMTQPRYSDAAEVVPVKRSQAAEPGGDIKPIVVQEFDAETSAQLLGAYGSHQVAVGTDVVLTGPELCQRVLDAGEEITVFGLREEDPDGFAQDG